MVRNGCHGGRHRKERVLHTRISDRLDEALRGAAEELRVPVSNLVRNVLEDVFIVVETVTENVGELVDDVIAEAGRVRGQFKRHRPHFRERGRQREADRETEAPGDEGPSPPEFPHVIGWQPLVLNVPQTCASCGRELGRGDGAHVGMGSHGLQPCYLCPHCLEALG
jgi:hypothetical protein